jgi:shikimate kinase
MKARKKGIWLIGFRGAGKTTVGRQIAERLGRAFLDVDEEWERRQGTKIVSFVEKEGLEAFRRGEEALLHEAALRVEQGWIVATGGGFVDWLPSRRILEASPFPKIFLDPPAELLWERLQQEEDRLRIGNLTTFDRMRNLCDARRPFYEKIATSTWKNQDISECLPALESLLEKP